MGFYPHHRGELHVGSRQDGSRFSRCLPLIEQYVASIILGVSTMISRSMSAAHLPGHFLWLGFVTATAIIICAEATGVSVVASIKEMRSTQLCSPTIYIDRNVWISTVLLSFADAGFREWQHLPLPEAEIVGLSGFFCKPKVCVKCGGIWCSGYLTTKHFHLPQFRFVLFGGYHECP